MPPTTSAAVEALRSKRWLDAAMHGLSLLAESSDAGEADWVVEGARDETGRRLAFRPVDVAAFAEPLLLRSRAKAARKRIARMARLEQENDQ